MVYVMVTCLPYKECNGLYVQDLNVNWKSRTTKTHLKLNTFTSDFAEDKNKDYITLEIFKLQLS